MREKTRNDTIYIMDKQTNFISIWLSIVRSVCFTKLNLSFTPLVLDSC